MKMKRTAKKKWITEDTLEQMKPRRGQKTDWFRASCHKKEALQRRL